MKIEINEIGRLADGQKVNAYTLTTANEFSVTILNLGGIIQKMIVPDKNSNKMDVICGYNDPQDYLIAGGYQGALIGRCGNRIANGAFELNGQVYHLYQNDNNNHLHGGKIGFNRRLWDVKASMQDGNGVLQLSLFSPDGEENYPGNLTVNVTYIVSETGSLTIHYRATTDADTVVNLTNHAYFNLDGYADGGIDQHTLWMDCDRFNNVDGGLIPDGTFSAVAGTPYDFLTEKKLGQDFGSQHPHMIQCEGYDTNFCVKDYKGDVRHIATLKGEKSGRVMKLYTDQPCIQIYTANMVDPEDPHFKEDVKQYKHCAVAMETQAMPDSINHKGFTNVVLKPGEVYDKTTVFEFSN